MRRSIRPYGIGLFWVPSHTEQGTDYLVDLSDPEWRMGRCDCPDFAIRVESHLAQDREPEKWCCKHILDAVRYVRTRRAF